MEKETFNRYVPEHPLPEEIREMEKDDTVCQFCGVSYLIHSEMKALEERVKEAERQMEYYKGSVEREEQLKVTVRILQEEKDKLSGALQASEETSKILTTDIVSKTELIEKIKTDNKKANEKWRKSEEQKGRLEDKFQQLSALWVKVQTDLATQKLELTELKKYVRDNNKHLSNMIKGVVTQVSEVSGHFASTIKDMEGTLKKVEMERNSELDKCSELKKQVEKQKEAMKDLQSASVEVQKLMAKCAELEEKTRHQQSEISEKLKVNQVYSKEISQLKEEIREKAKDLGERKTQSQKQEEALKEQIAELQSAEKAQESEVCRLNGKCRSLEVKLAEFAKDQDQDRQRASSSQEELVVLRNCLAKAKDDLNELKAEREKMITAHHNRIEQLRESFKRKTEESDGWPLKLEQMVKEKEDAFAKEKQQLWMELSQSFQKEMEEERKHHAEELRQWRNEAESAQGKFKHDITSLNRKHKDEVKRLERAVAEGKDRLIQTRQSNTALMENLQAKVLHLENRLQQPIVESAEEATYLKARLQESRNELHETEAYCKEMEAKAKQYKEEVFFLQETVRRECEERLELTESLSNARTQLLALQRSTGTSLSRNSLSLSKPSPSPLGDSVVGAKKTVSSSELVNKSGSQAATCAVGFDGGVGRKSSSGSRESGRLSRVGSVADGRQRIAVALGRPSSRSRLGGDLGS